MYAIILNLCADYKVKKNFDKSQTAHVTLLMISLQIYNINPYQEKT